MSVDAGVILNPGAGGKIVKVVEVVTVNQDGSLTTGEEQVLVLRDREGITLSVYDLATSTFQRNMLALLERIAIASELSANVPTMEEPKWLDQQ